MHRISLQIVIINSSNIKNDEYIRYMQYKQGQTDSFNFCLDWIGLITNYLISGNLVAPESVTSVFIGTVESLFTQCEKITLSFT